MKIEIQKLYFSNKRDNNKGNQEQTGSTTSM